MSDKIKKFPLSKEAKQRLALRKRAKAYRMSFEPSYDSKEEADIQEKRNERSKRRQEASDIRQKEKSTPKQRLAEKKAKEELEKGKVDITGKKSGKKISQYVAEQRNKKNKKKKIKSLLKKGVKVGGAFFTTLLTPKKAK